MQRTHHDLKTRTKMNHSVKTHDNLKNSDKLVEHGRTLGQRERSKNIYEIWSEKFMSKTENIPIKS